MSAGPYRHSTIYLLRHGRAACIGRMAGQYDSPLDPEGLAQMSAWAEFFAPIPISAVWHSPLERARQSAEIVTKALNNPLSSQDIRIEHDFIEISLGEWEGRTKGEVRAGYSEEWEQRGRDFMNFAPPGGESFADLSRRVVPAMKRLFDVIIEHRYVLIVAHQAVNRAILAEFGEPFRESWREIPQGPAVLNELELSQKRPGVFKCNIIRSNARPPILVA